MTVKFADTRKIRVWDLPLRIFHWLLVAAIAVALLSAEEDSALNQWHVTAGWIAGILLVFRIAWGFAGGEHSRFANFIRPAAVGQHLRALLRGRAEPTLGHNPLGAVSVLLLLTLIALTVWTGIVLQEDLHEILGWSLLALVVVHIAAVIFMSFLTRENLVAAMVAGAKPAERHPEAADARGPGLVALAFAALVVAGSIYAVLRFDPQAFTPRSTEAFEHRSDAATGESRDERRRGDRREQDD